MNRIYRGALWETYEDINKNINICSKYQFTYLVNAELHYIAIYYRVHNVKIGLVDCLRP